MAYMREYFSKDKKIKYNNLPAENHTENIESSVNNISTSEVSASEVASLRTEVWTLKTQIAESTENITNLQLEIKSLVREKYKLVDELNEFKENPDSLTEQCSSNTNIPDVEKMNLINEMALMRSKMSEREELLEKVTKQNIDLKVALNEANETIHNMGLMFLKMKGDQNFRMNDD